MKKDNGSEAFSKICKLFERLDDGEPYAGEIADQLDELIAGPIYDRLKAFRIIDRKNINIGKIKTTNSAQEYNEATSSDISPAEYRDLKELLVSPPPEIHGDTIVVNPHYTDLNSLFKPKSLYDDIACPYCGAKHFEIGHTTSTAVYIPVIVKDGKLTDPGTHNHSSTDCHCYACGKDFTFDEDHVCHKA